MTGQQLKNSILQMAVQGKLVPQDPNDEPASVLLARIRAEKEQLIKEGKIKKGKTYTYNFSFTIPSDAINGDKDEETGLNYPIMFFIPNLKDNSPYKAGDQITVLKAKFTVG